MQKFIETTGETRDAAIQAALKQLGLDRDDVSVEVLDNGKKCFLGIGATPARVRVTYEVLDEPVKPAEPVHTPVEKKKEEKSEKPKKLSITKEPKNSIGSTATVEVRIGRLALRSTCLKRTAVSLRPFARAVRT
mgnify:CR=1 FL=1